TLQDELAPGARAKPTFERPSPPLAPRKAGPLFVAVDALFTQRRERLVALAAAQHLPTIYGRREFAAVGGLIAYGASAAHQYRQSGYYVAPVLKGDTPPALPVLQPIKSGLGTNLKT